MSGREFLTNTEPTSLIRNVNISRKVDTFMLSIHNYCINWVIYFNSVKVGDTDTARSCTKKDKARLVGSRAQKSSFPAPGHTPVFCDKHSDVH